MIRTSKGQPTHFEPLNILPYMTMINQYIIWLVYVQIMLLRMNSLLKIMETIVTLFDIEFYNIRKDVSGLLLATIRFCGLIWIKSYLIIIEQSVIYNFYWYFV